MAQSGLPLVGSPDHEKAKAMTVPTTPHRQFRQALLPDGETPRIAPLPNR
jgi:hypothetical protein